MVPPSGGVPWAQVHCDRSLLLGNAHVPPGRLAVEGSEDGRASGLLAVKEAIHDFVSSSCMGRKAPGQAAVVSRAPLRETNRPAARARDWAVC